MRRGWFGVAVLLVAGVFARPAGAQQTHLLVITGLGGDPTYTEQFHDWASTLIGAAVDRHGVPAEHVTYLGERADLDPAIDDRSSRENVEAAVGAIAERAATGDHVVIVLFGHGSSSGEARINLPGRDLSADDFDRLLEPLGGQRVTFVNAASASGPFIEKLSGDGRVVVTATRSGGEWTAAAFGGYFVEAFADGQDEADQDKDGRVSMLEAFTYARLRVEQQYEADGLLATEHPLLDDNGDGEGTGEPDPLTGDGMVARSSFFGGGGEAAARAFPDDPELAQLYDEEQALEERVAELRQLRGGADEAQYEAELERVLIELALKSRAIRQLEAARAGGDPR